MFADIRTRNYIWIGQIKCVSRGRAKCSGPTINLHHRYCYRNIRHCMRLVGRYSTAFAVDWTRPTYWSNVWIGSICRRICTSSETHARACVCLCENITFPRAHISEHRQEINCCLFTILHSFLHRKRRREWETHRFFSPLLGFTHSLYIIHIRA